MVEREDPEQQRRTAPNGRGKCGLKGGQEVPEGESKENDSSQFINEIGFYENHRLLGDQESRSYEPGCNFARIHSTCEPSLLCRTDMTAQLIPLVNRPELTVL
jgi:hypothetical protein